MRRAALCSILAGMVSLVFADDMLRQPVKPGETYQIDCSWRIIELPRTAWIHPQLKAFDADGKQTYFRWDAGNYVHRTFDPSDPCVEKWRFYIQVKTPDGGNAKMDRRFSMGLATIVVPAETACLEISLIAAGDPSRHSDAVIKATKLDAPPKKPSYKMPPFNTPARLLSDAELDARLAATSRKRAELRSTGSRTTLYVDGKPIVPRIWKGGKKGEWEAVEQFGACGFNVFKVYFSGHEVWRTDGGIDARKIRADLRRCLKVNPEALFVFQFSIRPRMNWGADNPDDVYQNQKRLYAVFKGARVVEYTPQPIADERERYAMFSYMSRKFADEMSDAIRRIFTEIETWPESKNVIGVYVTGGADGQWLDLFDNSVSAGRQAADYSPAGQRRYREHLRRKYGSAEALGKAWGRDGAVSFDSVEVPSEDALSTTKKQFFRMHGASPESDWRESWAMATTEMRLQFSRAIKEATGRRILIGAYSPNGGLEGFPLISETDSKSLIMSPDYDFFAVVPAYAREFSDPVRAGAYTGSFVRRGKLYVSELDLRNAEVGTWGVWGTDFWRENHNAATFRRKAIFYATDSFVHGGAYHACDMGGGYYNTPAAMETWKAVNRVADHVRILPWSPNHAAIVGGERYWDYQSMCSGRVFPYHVREMTGWGFAFSGVPHDNYLLDEVLADHTAAMPKLVVFNDLSTVTPEQFRELRRRYARDGRVLVYSWRLGCFAPGGEEIEREMGLEISSQRSDGRQITADGSVDDPLMRGVKGLFAPCKYYLGDAWCVKPVPLAEKGWKPLAFVAGTNVTGVAVRRGTDCTEVYVSIPNSMPMAFVRNLAREAGFAPTIESDDISGCGSGLFYILAQTDGVKRFRLPDGGRPGKVLEGPGFSDAGGGVFEVALKRAQIFVLEVK